MINLEKKSLPIKALKVYKIWATIFMSILSFVSGMIAVFDMNTAIISISIFMIIYVYTILYYCPKKYTNEKYFISDAKIYKEKGVFFKQQTEIMIDKIQCIKIITDPIQKFFELYTVIFYSSGYTEKIVLIDFAEAKNIERNFYKGEENEV